jgi:hypothetical protein
VLLCVAARSHERVYKLCVESSHRDLERARVQQEQQEHSKKPATGKTVFPLESRLSVISSHPQGRPSPRVFASYFFFFFHIHNTAHRQEPPTHHPREDRRSARPRHTHHQNTKHKSQNTKRRPTHLTIDAATPHQLPRAPATRSVQVELVAPVEARIRFPLAVRVVAAIRRVPLPPPEVQGVAVRPRTVGVIHLPQQRGAALH